MSHIPFKPLDFDIAYQQNLLLEVNAKLREISSAIHSGLLLESLDDYDSQFLEIQRSLFFFYAKFAKAIEDSRGGRSDDEKANVEFRQIETQEALIYQELWQLYRSVIGQRSNPDQKSFLEVGDIISQSLFDEFLGNEKLRRIKPEYFTYSKPLTFLGDFNRYDYYTIFPKYLNKYKMNIPIISVSRSASGAMWYLLAVPHEIGHDIMGNIKDFEEEAELLIQKTIDKRVYDFGSVTMPIYDRGSNILIEKKYTANELMKVIWTHYLSETFADIVGVLLTGPAFLLSSLELLGGSKFHEWKVEEAGPEEHPPPYLRIYTQSRLLSKLGFERELKKMNDLFEYVSGLEDVITWFSDLSVPGKDYSFRIDLGVMEQSADDVLHTLLSIPFKCLDNNTVNDLVKAFSQDDQKMIEALAEKLRTGDWTLNGIGSRLVQPKPKHVLSASRWSVSRYPEKADVVQDAGMKMILRHRVKW